MYQNQPFRRHCRSFRAKAVDTWLEPLRQKNAYRGERRLFLTTVAKMLILISRKGQGLGIAQAVQVLQARPYKYSKPSRTGTLAQAVQVLQARPYKCSRPDRTASTPSQAVQVLQANPFRYPSQAVQVLQARTYRYSKPSRTSTPGQAVQVLQARPYRYSKPTYLLKSLYATRMPPTLFIFSGKIRSDFCRSLQRRPQQSENPWDPGLGGNPWGDPRDPRGPKGTQGDPRAPSAPLGEMGPWALWGLFRSHSEWNAISSGFLAPSDPFKNTLRAFLAPRHPFNNPYERVADLDSKVANFSISPGAAGGSIRRCLLF